MTDVIYAVAFQSVDPDEAFAGGCQWSIFREELDRFMEEERQSPHEADFEYTLFTLLSPLPLSGMSHVLRDVVTEWVDHVAWTTPNSTRVVILGSDYPGAEARRIAAESETTND